MPTQILLIPERSVALAAFERTVLVVDHFDVTLEIPATSESGVAQVASVRSLVGVRFEVCFQRARFHDAMARQALNTSAFSFANDDCPHLDSALAIFFYLL